MAPPGQGCVDYALELGAAMAGVGVPVGFFQAHSDLKKLTIQEKLVRMNSFRVAGPALARPMATFAAAGAAYAMGDCLMQDYLGRRDSLTGIVGGAAVGAVLGLKHGSLAKGLGYGAAVAGATLVVEFYTKIAHPAFDDLTAYGPKPVPPQ